MGELQYLSKNLFRKRGYLEKHQILANIKYLKRVEDKEAEMILKQLTGCNMIRVTMGNMYYLNKRIVADK